VHVVSATDAAARGALAGVGLSFNAQGTEFDQRLTGLIEEYRARKPKVLVVDEAGPYREQLVTGLSGSNMDVLVARDSAEAMDRLTDGLFSLDLMVIDVAILGLDVMRLVWRIRKLGGEADLRIVLLVAGRLETAQELKGPHGANEVVSHAAPMLDLIAKLSAVLGR
jgi:CheY-like chemotaxis protein